MFGLLVRLFAGIVLAVVVLQGRYKLNQSLPTTPPHMDQPTIKKRGPRIGKGRLPLVFAEGTQVD